MIFVIESLFCYIRLCWKFFLFNILWVKDYVFYDNFKVYLFYLGKIVLFLGGCLLKCLIFLFFRVDIFIC